MFVWLTTEKGDQWLVNAAYIFSVRNEKGKTVVKLSDASEIYVQEQQSEVALMIKLAK